jgi:TatD DNase family protein
MPVDSHCHLDFPEFAPYSEVIASAKLAGVHTMVTISTLVSRYDAYREIAESDPNVFFTVGTHPHQADSETHITAQDLIALSNHPKCIGIGEVGLDYYYQKSTPENQAYGFRTHIEAARKTGLPLIIHSRDAEEDTSRILTSAKADGDFPALMHCFTASNELAATVLNLGLYISFSGVLTYKSAPNLRELARIMPADRMLVETDAPYLGPGKFRGKRNEPAYVVETLKVLAEARGISYEEADRITTDNFFRLFKKAVRL